ncbi:MAG: DUF4296 domain-containing protein [Bacteroidota bacterium]
MKQKIALIFICILLFSCSGKQEVSIPDTVFPIEKMVKVMLDIHLLEATLNSNTYSPDKAGAFKPSPTTDVLKENGISKKQWDESFYFYSQHPDLLVKIYEQLLNDLSTMQAEAVNKK